MKECCKTYLAEQFGGDEDIMNEIYGEYVQSVHEKIGELKAALDSADWQGADKIAHTVKGNSLAAGDNEVSQRAIELRKFTALNDLEKCRALLAEIEELAKGL